MQLTPLFVLSVAGWVTASVASSSAADVVENKLKARGADSYGEDGSHGKHGRGGYDDGLWYPGKYEGNKQFDDGSWYPGKYPDGSQYDDGSWFPGKYPDGSWHDSGSWKGNGLQARGSSSYDDGLWYPGKYEGKQYDDGSWRHSKHHKSYIKDKCPSRHHAVPFQRMCYPDSFGAASIIGYFFNYQVCNFVVPLFVAYKEESKDYFYTTDERELHKAVVHKGYRDQGSIGFIFSRKACGSVPLYRLYHPKACQHFYTTSWEEKEKAMKCGYEYRGVEGYIYRW